MRINKTKLDLTDEATLFFIGMSDTKMKIISLISDVLIIGQGIYGLYCTNKNTRSIIRRLILTTIWLFAIHVVLIVTKLIISHSYVKSYHWREVDSQQNMNDEEIEEMEYFIYGLIVSTFLLSCIII